MIIAPEGSSGFRCVCGEHLTLIEEASILEEEEVTCRSCSRVMFIDASVLNRLRVSVLTTDAHLLDADTITNQSFFHATHRDDWHEVITSTPELLVHVGSFSSAHIRLRDSVEKRGWKNHFWSMYEVRVLPQAAINPKIVADAFENWPSYRAQLTQFPHMIDGVNRYLNAWETPGSISLLLPTTALEVVNRYSLDSFEQAQALSL